MYENVDKFVILMILPMAAQEISLVIQFDFKPRKKSHIGASKKNQHFGIFSYLSLNLRHEFMAIYLGG